MNTCGGSISTMRVNLSSKPIQLVGALESRTRLTVRADQTNDAAVYLVASPSQSWREGFPLFPGEAYTFDDRGVRAAVYGVGPNAGDKIVYVLTEGA